MINVLLENTQIDAPWLYGSLKKYIKPNFRVAVVALSFKENRVRNLEDWDALYSKENGKYYGSIAGGLLSYGIQEENISFLNWFKDTKETAARTVEMADIVYFLGGLPDRMMERIRAYNQCCHTGHHEQQPHPSGHPLQIPHKGQGDTQVNRRRQHSSWLGQAIQDKRQLPVRPLHKLHDNHRDHPECITDHKCQIQFVEKMQLGGPDAPDHKSRNGDQRPDKNDYCYVVHWLLLF